MYAWLSTVIICAQNRAKYALGELKLDVKDMYICERNSKSQLPKNAYK